MRLESARALKEEVRDRMRSSTRTATRSISLGPATSPFEDEQPQPAFAIGIKAGANREDYRLTLRLYRGREDWAVPALRRVAANSEVEVVRGVKYELRARATRPARRSVPARRGAVVAGESCGHFRITAGTVGVFVTDHAGHICILSNNHVLADSDRGVAGDPILYPGPIDAQGRPRVVAKLTDWIPLSQARTDGVDAAIARLESNVTPKPLAGFGTTPVADRESVRKVEKRGRTTKTTTGVVSAFELDDVTLNYGTARKPIWIRFDNQLEFVGDPEATPFSQGGDSGSLIYDAESKQPYSLLYGGGPDAAGVDRTLGHFLPSVLNPLAVTIV